jgi:hypothetical protein
VNAAPGDWHDGDALPPVALAREQSAAVHGGKASKGRNAPRESAGIHGRAAFASRDGGEPGGNVVNPRVGSAVQHPRAARKEQAGEVV